jgi:hypothetical protein
LSPFVGGVAIDRIGSEAAMGMRIATWPVENGSFIAFCLQRSLFLGYLPERRVAGWSHVAPEPEQCSVGRKAAQPERFSSRYEWQSKGCLVASCVDGLWCGLFPWFLVCFLGVTVSVAVASEGNKLAWFEWC